MTSPLLDTIVGRMFLVMALGLIVSHALSVSFYLNDRQSTINLVGGEHISERMVTLARLVERAPGGEKEKIARLASETVLDASLGPTPSVARKSPDTWEEKVLTDVFAQHLGRHGGGEFRLSYRDASLGNDSRKLMQVSLRLQGGEWLNCSAVIDAASSVWSPRFLLSLAVMTIAIVLVSAIVVYHINRPLRIFAGAARRLGTNINAPSLPVKGPRELRYAIDAFNGMQERLKRLISDRRQMLAAVSHDLRTPITLLRLRAEFVENGEEREKMLTTLTEMESMVESILDFIRDDAVEEEVGPADISAMIDAICDDVGDLGGTAVFNGSSRLIYPCRPTALKRALTNVIDNAEKFGGRVHVNLEAGPDSVTILVEDEGPGIPEAELESVFNPFYRVEASRSRDTGGVGLGLSVARSIVAAHGGTITLQNRPTGGLSVRIELPRLSESQKGAVAKADA